jgi:hypothetical protein
MELSCAVSQVTGTSFDVNPITAQVSILERILTWSGTTPAKEKAKSATSLPMSSR